MAGLLGGREGAGRRGGRITTKDREGEEGYERREGRWREKKRLEN